MYGMIKRLMKRGLASNDVETKNLAMKKSLEISEDQLSQNYKRVRKSVLKERIKHLEDKLKKCNDETDKLLIEIDIIAAKEELSGLNK